MGTEWQEEAACRDSNLSFFYEGYSQSRMAVLKAAIEVCNRCPVRAACLKASSPEDRKWTIRGGNLPKQVAFAGNSNMDNLMLHEGSEARQAVDRAIERGICRNKLHEIKSMDDLLFRVRGSRFIAACRECERSRDRRAKAARRAKLAE